MSGDRVVLEGTVTTNSLNESTKEVESTVRIPVQIEGRPFDIILSIAGEERIGSTVKVVIEQ